MCSAIGIFQHKQFVQSWRLPFYFICVWQLTQAAQGLAEGTNVQVAYGDYMINYMLEKAGGSEDEQTAEAMETTHEAMETTHEAVTAVSAVVETEGEVAHQQEYTGEATSVTQTTVEGQQVWGLIMTIKVLLWTFKLLAELCDAMT